MTDTTPSAASTPTPCVLCQKSREGDEQFVNGQGVCSDCLAQVQREIRAEANHTYSTPAAFAAGLAGAVLGGLVWAAITVLSKFQIGYLAVGIGYAVVQAMKWVVGPARSKTLQVIALVNALTGWCVGGVLTVAGILIREGQAQSLPPIEVALVSVLAFPAVLSLWDALWVFLAANYAWRGMAQTRALMSQPEQSDG